MNRKPSSLSFGPAILLTFVVTFAYANSPDSKWQILNQQAAALDGRVNYTEAVVLATKGLKLSEKKWGAG